MSKLLNASASYAVLGLIAGVFYREFTRAYGFEGKTQLSTLHTHFLVLGMVFFLIVLALNAVFRLEEQKLFDSFFITYNVGLLWTTTMMVVHGIWQVAQSDEFPPALAGVSGLGHIFLAVAFFLFFRMLYRAVNRYERAAT